MQRDLLKDLTSEQQRVVRLQALEGKLLFKQVAKVLEERLSTCERKRRARSNYFMPGWKMYQADCNGYMRGIEDCVELIKSISDQEAIK